MQQEAKKNKKAKTTPEMDMAEEAAEAKETDSQVAEETDTAPPNDPPQTDEADAIKEDASSTSPSEEDAEKLQNELNKLQDKHLRLIAEYDNFRKRSQRERDEIYPTAMTTAIGKFLPVLDNLERAAAFPHGDDEFGKGFDMIYQSFKDVLASLEVEEMGEVGEDFDPEIHHAVMHIEDDSLGENVIAQVLQKGYRIGDKVIRYAMVQTAN